MAWGRTIVLSMVEKMIVAKCLKYNELDIDAEKDQLA